MRLTLNLALVVVTLALATLTFLPLLEADKWWVRMTDFPRLQYSIALFLVLIVLAIARPLGQKFRVLLAVLAIAALSFNIVKLAPYFISNHDLAASCDEGDQLSIMVANVKVKNREAAELLKLVRARDVDILLALETDDWWDAKLADLADAMPYSISEISDDAFGMHLFSALPLDDTRIEYPVGQDAPALQATVELRSGKDVRFIGLHPRPPQPGQSTIGRDGQLAWAAVQSRDVGPATVLAGDFNAVPWETTVERAQRVGKLFDPREVAGYMSTFDAHSWWMSWPLDQIMHREGLTVMSMEVLASFGSDHYPVEVRLCHDATEREPPSLRRNDLAEAAESIDAAHPMTGK